MAQNSHKAVQKHMFEHLKWSWSMFHLFWVPTQHNHTVFWNLWAKWATNPCVTQGHTGPKKLWLNIGKTADKRQPHTLP